MQKYDVTVVFGGISNENEISVITGTMVCNVLKKSGMNVLPVFISQEGVMYAGEELADIANFKGEGYLKSCVCAVCGGGLLLFNKKGKCKKRAEVDCALNCCHGGDGEGGGVCGLFAMNNIPLASAGLFESSAFMDKYYTKLVLKSLGVKTADYVYIRDMSGATEAEALGYPLIVKPCRLGSSIGIEKAKNREELSDALETAFMYDGGVIVEKFLSPRREINCAAYFYGGEVITSECEEAVARGELLSYDDKYCGGGKSVYPADISPSIAEKVKNTTRLVYSSLNMRGIVRFDYILCGNSVILSEINTVPGSLSYYLLSRGFDDFYNVLLMVIAQCKADAAARKEKVVLNTGIINNISSKACKIK